MEPIEVLKMAKSLGVDFKVFGKDLKGSNLNALSNETRQWVRNHKSDIIRLLTSASDHYNEHSTTIQIDPDLDPCPVCHGRKFIHGHKGGYFCIECTESLPEGNKIKAGGNRHKAFPPSINTPAVCQKTPDKLYCFVCRSTKWWRKKDGTGPWVCAVCHPSALEQGVVEYFTIRDD